ncbi:sensor histidine kinase [Actinoallomurus soli]|uniref:sensor histidine kinase n=1 Tax=Actinoallomurus soli TaxID=2952535 RepID=UPI0020928A46|nr:HAMP domain-containing sensor histidine kinase [Actinoallomurus soli]MCO5968853.1 HAMP domain-containing histidine kinase [Actinoallomurus soli]
MRRSLALVSAAVTSMVALAFLIPLALMVKEIARDRALNDAERQAGSLAPALAVTTDRAALQRAVASTQAGAAGRMAVHLPLRTGGTVGTSRARSGDLATATTRGRSFSAPAAGGYVLLQPVALDQDRTAIVEVYLPRQDLARGVRPAWITLTVVAAVLVAGSVVVADRLGARVVGSARTLARAATALGGGDLRTRIDPQGPPELRDAGRAFNTMADRVEQLLAAERELIADLSHRLRTPLTAMRLNAAALGPEPAAEQTRLAVARLEEEVDSIIRSARKPKETARCDAAEVLRDRMAFWSALAEDQERDCELIGADTPVAVPVPRGELSAVLDSLLGNVFRHTAEGTAFAVTLHAGAGLVGILVADAGPGIADPEAALRRGSSGGGSTGLGLDIARRMAETVGGDVRIDRSPALGGAQVQIWLPTTPKRPRRNRRP